MQLFYSTTIVYDKNSRIIFWALYSSSSMRGSVSRLHWALMALKPTGYMALYSLFGRLENLFQGVKTYYETDNLMFGCHWSLTDPKTATKWP
jgi:hypothetical protein